MIDDRGSAVIADEVLWAVGGHFDHEMDDVAREGEDMVIDNGGQIRSGGVFDPYVRHMLARHETN